ncbi:putative zinc-containing alcohol dehydrogenase superfamily (fragment) [Brochothrix thermosphacta]|uniref:NADP-dependent oxidoreductase n=1 Tax=Brochothrix thermosphacta TaxID=2756 RepID=UPI000D7765AE
MKAMQISQYGKDEKVILTEVKTPAVGAHDILIEVYAASVNPVDYKLRDGALKAVRPKKLPLTLGNDFAGIVTKIGAEVTRFKEGDAVYGAASADRWGSFAEYFVVGEQYAALKPSNLSFTEAASLPLTALTAYQALTEWLDVQPSQKIFIPGVLVVWVLLRFQSQNT